MLKFIGQQLFIFSIASLLQSIDAATASKPNIVMVVVDDWGYADVGFRNPNIVTPNFQDLVKQGLILDRHYVYKVCSPSRASLLTGRWPHHVYQFNIRENMEYGVNLHMTMIPAKLKTAGYKTHMIGKWHLGFYDPAYIPIKRGFDTSSGYLGGGNDYMNQWRICAVDFWKNGQEDTRNGTYDAYIYRDDLTNIFANHRASEPLFLYLSLHNVHLPLQVPKTWLDLYPVNSTCSTRRMYQAMVSVADNLTGHVVQLLKEKHMWDNTLFIVTADNGGEKCIASNYPLKGTKGTFFEGGVRALAFASGGLIPENMRGKSTDGFIHIADWYTTFCKLAGVDPDDSGTGKFPVDGLDVWPMITGASTTSPHEEIILGYNLKGSGALIYGKYKLIVGKQSTKCASLQWAPLNYPCSEGPTGENCNPYCLYDIISDPMEKQNLANSEPQLLQEMLERYNAHDKEPLSEEQRRYNKCICNVPRFKGTCQYMKDKGGYWRPWKQQ